MTVARKPDRVSFARAARRDLDAQLDYLAERNPAASLALADAIGETLAMLAARDPRLDGREVELDTGERCRRIFVHPLTIYYQRAPGEVLIVRVYHHARQPLTRE